MTRRRRPDSALREKTLHLPGGEWTLTPGQADWRSSSAPVRPRRPILPVRLVRGSMSLWTLRSGMPSSNEGGVRFIKWPLVVSLPGRRRHLIGLNIRISALFAPNITISLGVITCGGGAHDPYLHTGKKGCPRRASNTFHSREVCERSEREAS